MKKLFTKWKSFSGFFRAFLILAFAFLVVGLGSLGTASSAGKAYGLWVQTEGDEETPAIVLQVSEPTAKDSNTANYRVRKVFVNVGAIYGEPGEIATLRLGRAYSATSAFTTYVDGKIENFYSDTTDDSKATRVAASNALYNWVEPFSVSENGWSLSSYRYFCLTATTHNVLINEIVFVGEGVAKDGTVTTGLCVLPVKLYTGAATRLPAEPRKGETSEQARERALKEASAIIDAQSMPSNAQSSFFRFSKEEVNTLMTIREIRTGNSYDSRNVGLYRGDVVYGALGNDILALGTMMFGMSPFGLRFFPMLASFGVLVFGTLFTRRLLKSDKAGFIFAILYALSNFAFGLGHLGTPLMLGVFFFVAALDLVHRFYVSGMKKADFASAAPVAFAGLLSVCAILTNSVWAIPFVGIVVLFAIGMVRQKKAARAQLDLAIGEAEELETALEEAQAAHASDAQSTKALKVSERKLNEEKQKAARVAQENKFKNVVAPVMFVLFCLIGALLVSVLSMYPVSTAYRKLFDNPAAPSLGLFGLIWETLKGGFVGKYVGVNSPSAWAFFYEIFRGTGSAYAVTGIVYNVVGLLASVFGMAYGIYRLALLAKADKNDPERKGELCSVLIPLLALVLAAIGSAFGAGAGAFRALVTILSFTLFAGGWKFFSEAEDTKTKKAMKALSVVGLVLLAAFFALTVFFTFSIPLPASLMTKLF